MNKDSIWKWILLVGLICLSLERVYPLNDIRNDQGDIVQEGKLKLGLDLQGGASFTVEVQRDEVARMIKEETPAISDSDLASQVDEDVKAAKDVALEVIRNRIDGLGTSEPEIYPQTDTDNIIIRLPGITAENIQGATDLIERAAFLQFRLVHLDSDQWVSELFGNQQSPRGYKIPDVPNAQYYIRDTSIKDHVAINDLGDFGFRGKAELMLSKDSVADGSTIFRPMYVEIRNQLSGTSLKGSSVEYNPNDNMPYISIEFDGAGSEAFARVTSQYAPRGDNNQDSDLGRRLAVVMDGTLYSAPTIQEAIYGGTAQITGRFSTEEAFRLSNALRAGSLKAPLEIIQKSEVSPTLGQDSINSGVKAVVSGGIAVLLFMALYYMTAGVVANVSLLLVMILLPFGMWFSAEVFSMFNPDVTSQGGLPVLTLPGIAGIVLTIGMAVDANVLIFERIREELRSGKSVVNAINFGYDKAFSTIMDANVTTFLTAAILFWKGSGAIRGFAVTLSAGIFVSMLVVLVFTRLFLTTMAETTKMKSMKMMSIVKANTKIDFVGKRKIATIISIVLILGTWSKFAANGEKNFGIDFTGGTSYLFTFDQQPDEENVRDTLATAGISDATIQYQKTFGAEEGSQILEVKVGFEEGETALAAMQTTFADSGMVEAGENKIGAQIGAELRNQGVVALIVAMIGIIIYISIRFEFAFAVGAIVALLHDVLITIGIYCLFGRQLSLPIIAALLTIVGYSVNDTIVVFDRIREDIKLMKGKASYSEIANLSINQTLSRTLLTSLTTLLTVVMLVLFGGGAINDFAVALLIGIMVGTYSSIFIATPVVLLWHKEKKV